MTDPIKRPNFTCEQAMNARYRVTGTQGKISECAIYLTFNEAVRYYASLLAKGYEVEVVASFGGRVLKSKSN